MLELLFDLVFVFAITQITTLLHQDPTWQGVAHAGLLLALMWGPWMGFSWLGNIVDADEPVVRAGVIVAMVAVFGMALAVPDVFEPAGSGVAPAVLLVASYAVVRLVNLTVFLLAARGDRGLQRQLGRFTVPLLLDCSVLAVGAVIGQPWQVPLWVLALVADYAGTILIGADGWRLASPAHFAERHGLIVIVALGESVVAVGAAVTGQPLVWPVLVAVLLGLLVTVGLWWAYFDAVAVAAERALADVAGPARSAAALDAYSYLHLPMVAGIVFLALGLRETLTLVASGHEHALAHPLPAVGATALLGGVAVYLGAHAAFRWRLERVVSRRRVVLSLVLAGCVPVATRVPALVSLAGLAALLLVTVGGELRRHQEAGEQPLDVALD